jgi:hypothetical protein
MINGVEIAKILFMLTSAMTSREKQILFSASMYDFRSSITRCNDLKGLQDSGARSSSMKDKTSLNLQSANIGEFTNAQFWAFCHTISKCQRLNILDLENNKLNKLGSTSTPSLGSHIVALLKSTPKLEALILKNNSLYLTSKTDIETIGQEFENLKQLAYLDISQNGLCDSNLASVIYAVSKLPNLVVLDLSNELFFNKTIDVEELRAVLDALNDTMRTKKLRVVLFSKEDLSVIEDLECLQKAFPFIRLKSKKDKKIAYPLEVLRESRNKPTLEAISLIEESIKKFFPSL